MGRFKGKTVASTLIALITLLGMWYIHKQDFQFQKSLRNIAFDNYQSILPREKNESAVIIIDVDEASIAALGQWPWARTKLAEIVEKVSSAGAFAIGFDMVFAESDRTDPSTILKDIEVSNNANLLKELEKLPSNDERFAKAISNANISLGFADGQGSIVNEAKPVAGISWLGEDLSERLEKLDGTIASLPTLQEGAKGSGAFVVGVDQSDDLIRTIPMFVNVNGKVHPTLSIDTLRVAIEAATQETQSFLIKTSLASGESGAGTKSITEAKIGEFIFPLTNDGRIQIYYSHYDKSRLVPAYKIIEGDKDDLKQAFEGKIVLFGTSASGLRDIRTTALRERVPGVAIHAQIIDQIMQGKFLSRPDWAPGLERLILAVSSILIILFLPFWGAIISAIFGGFIAFCIVAGSWYAFSKYGILIDPIFPTLFSLLLYGLLTAMLYAFAEKEKRFVRNAFQHYLAPELLDRLENSPDSLKLGGEIKELTLMFMDIRGFTPISEKLDPQELVTFLNQLLSPLSEEIQKHEGAIDKYIGDSIMAFWNAPLDVEKHPEKACIASLCMIEILDEMNRNDMFGFSQRGLDNVSIGIGLNTGDGCVGNMGSKSRFDYSVVGDTVNVAARLESQSKHLGWPILASEATVVACPDFAFLPAGKLELKGKSEKQNVFALVGDAEFAASEAFSQMRKHHSSFIVLSLDAGKKVISDKRVKYLKAVSSKFHKFIEKIDLKNFE